MAQPQVTAPVQPSLSSLATVADCGPFQPSGKEAGVHIVPAVDSAKEKAEKETTAANNPLTCPVCFEIMIQILKREVCECLNLVTIRSVKSVLSAICTRSCKAKEPRAVLAVVS